MKKTSTTVRMERDGTLTRVVAGRKKLIKPSTPREMTDAELLAAARSDPDNPPLAKKSVQLLKRVPRVQTLRRALSLTQQEFAARYHIPLGTLRDWEQGRSSPDQPARAYLTVIARDPEHVRKALQRESA
jgi:putative transcriptional regulator